MSETKGGERASYSSAHGRCAFQAVHARISNLGFPQRMCLSATKDITSVGGRRKHFELSSQVVVAPSNLKLCMLSA